MEQIIMSPDEVEAMQGVAQRPLLCIRAGCGAEDYVESVIQCMMWNQYVIQGCYGAVPEACELLPAR